MCACRCDNITISPALLGELEKSKEPLPRKLWPTMGGCDEPQVDMHESNKSLFDKLHGEDQMAVDKLKEGIEGMVVSLCVDRLMLIILYAQGTCWATHSSAGYWNALNTKCCSCKPIRAYVLVKTLCQNAMHVYNRNV